MLSVQQNWVLAMTMNVGGSVPGEGATDAEIQFLTCVHWQGFIAVRFTQAVHGTPDVSVSDGTELSPENRLLPGVGPFHHGLDGVQDLTDKRSSSQRVITSDGRIVVKDSFSFSNFSRNAWAANAKANFLLLLIVVIKSDVFNQALQLLSTVFNMNP